jgi:hypothetical protein
MVGSRSLWSLLSLFLLAWLAPAAAAQQQKAPDIRYLIPERIERATKADDQGLLQWTPWEATKCQTCAGTGKTDCSTCFRFLDEIKSCIECGRKEGAKAVCRSCGGSGEYQDPLEKAHCPGCMACAFLICTVCSGSGVQKISGGGDRWSKCVACRGDGGFACGFCKGERLVEPASIKPSMKDASSANAGKAIAAIDKALAALGKFEANGNDSRKDVKELQKIFKEVEAYLPPLKRGGKVVNDYMNKIYAGKTFVAYKEMEANALNQLKSRTEYYLKIEKRMLELIQKRAEANEKLLAEQKDKK